MMQRSLVRRNTTELQAEFKTVDFETSSDYLELCQRTLTYYAELKRRLEDEKVRESIQNDDVFLIFGPTRSGKSSFLLRMKSDMSSGQFKDLMAHTMKNPGLIIKESDIEIGYGNLAITMVPNFYQIGSKLMIDLAGFDDLTPDRVPIISFLNYYLLKKISKARLLTVVTFGSIFDNNVNGTVRAYFSKYVDLLTEEHVPKGIASSLFVITKTDFQDVADPKTWYKSHMNQFAVDMSSQDEKFSKISSKMANSYFIPDYSLEKRELLEELDIKLQRLTTINTDILNLDLSSVSNTIITQCVKVTNKFYSYIKLINKTFEDVRTSFMTVEEFIRKRVDFTDRTNKIKQFIMEAKEIIKKSSDDIVKIGSEIKEQSGRISFLEEDIKLLEGQKQNFETKQNEFNLVIMKVAHSVYRDNHHKIYLEYEKPAGSLENTMPIVIDRQIWVSHGESISKVVNMARFQEMKIEDLKLNEQYRKDISITQKNGNLSIESKLKLSHSILLLNTCKINNTSLVSVLTDYFDQKIENNKQSIEVVKSKIQGQRKEIQRLDELKKQQKDRIKSLVGESEIIDQKSTDECLEIRNQQTSKSTSLEIMHVFLTKLQDDPILTITTSIAKVLLESKIGVGELKEISDKDILNQKNLETTIELLDQVRTFITDLSVIIETNKQVVKQIKELSIL